MLTTAVTMADVDAATLQKYAARIPHGPKCTGPAYVVRPGTVSGDTLLKCSGCWRWTLLAVGGVTVAPTATRPSRTPSPPAGRRPIPTPAEPVAPALAPVVAPPAPGSLVCRDHGYPVSHKGTGCPACTTARARQEAAARRRRRSARG